MLINLYKLLIIYAYFSLSAVVFATEAEIVNVGIYQNKPKVFIDSNNQPAGYFVDILNEIAKEDNLNLNYIPCMWSECLDMLEAGKLDIMPDVAYSIDRDKRFIFSNEILLSTWSNLYRHKDVNVESILDLENKKIAVLKESVQHSSIIKLLKEYDLTPHSFVNVDTWSDGFEKLSKNEADVLVINRFYELGGYIDENIVKTNILLLPSILKYAFSPTREELRNRVDSYIGKFKDDSESVIYDSEKRWITSKEERHLPQWVIWGSLGGMFIILVLIFLTIIFRKMVAKKSKELIEKERIILLQSKQASMGEMISMITHQWRQPLSVISMGANSIKLAIELEEDIEDELENYLNTVFSQVEYLSNTIDDFREFFKENKTKDKSKISDIVNSVKKIFGNSLENSNIEFIVDIKDDYVLYTYRNELMQVLLNIINNAKDILKDRKIPNAKIMLGAYKARKYYIIEICDNGGGIPENIIDKIGKQYFTTKMDDKGTGLGIYMSKMIVEEHLDGYLSWKNIDGKACFTVSIKK